jgi:16S rRNA (uracil1498-N3)-methyltransferase
MLPYFYHKDLQIKNQSFNLTEETSKHCVQVLRMHEGAMLKLTNGLGLIATVEIIMAHKKNALVKIISHLQEITPLQKNTIAISLLKNSTRIEWFLEKSTELGLFEIVLLLCKRTERQLFKKERYESILISAMLQSQQSFLPLLREPIKYNEFVENTTQQKKYIAHCVNEEKKPLQEMLQTNSTQLILIGPEGDFDDAEINVALKNNFVPVTLGNTRLRTETAGVVAATLMQLH